jgi:hypothetical protein
MPESLDKLISDMETAAKSGVGVEDQLVLRALRIPDIYLKVSSLLERNYSLISARPLPARLRDIAEVIFIFSAPPGSASLSNPAVIGLFQVATNAFVSVTDEFALSQSLEVTARSGLGALPFALATPSYTEASAIVGVSPALQAVQSRRQTFSEGLAGSAPYDTTSYPSQSSTGYPSSELTPYPTSGMTTPNDNDTQADNRADTTTDYQTDYTTDYQDDPDNGSRVRILSQTPYPTSYLTNSSTPYPTAGMTTPNDVDNFPDPQIDSVSDSQTDYSTDPDPRP